MTLFSFQSYIFLPIFLTTFFFSIFMLQFIYSYSSLLNHSCSPNTERSVAAKGQRVFVRAKSYIPKGTSFTIDHTSDVLFGTKERNNLLVNGSCRCLGCQGSATYVIPSISPEMSIAQRTFGPVLNWNHPLPSKNCQVFNLIDFFLLKNNNYRYLFK